MNHWTIERVFEVQTIAILASGPSMSQAVADQVRAAGIQCIVVNQTYELMPDAAILYAADHAWWHVVKPEFSGLRLSVAPNADPCILRGVHLLRNLGVVGYSDDRCGVHTFGNSGAQAIQVAVKGGAARVLLFGFDMHGGHWHAPHPEPLVTTPAEVYEHRFVVKMTRYLAPPLAERGIEVINCTPGSALTCWPAMSLEDALEACGESVASGAALSA